MSTHPAAVIILAAGEGTRMKSRIPKVLHPLAGRSLLGHALHAARDVGAEHVSVVVRHQRDRVAEHITEVDSSVVIADQDEVKGTGRACECGLEALPADLSGTVLVTMGDVPLLTAQTLRALIEHHEQTASAATVMSAELDDPSGYGRIVRDPSGEVQAILEHKDALAARESGGPDAHVVDIQEINSGIYAFDAEVLRDALAGVGTDNSQGEKYITDVLAIARRDGRRVSAYITTDHWQTEGVNDRAQLATLGKVMNERILTHWMREGVSIPDPASVWIDADVTLGPDTTVLPGTQLLGATTIGQDVTIGPDTTITSVEIGDGASVVRTHAEHSVIGPGASVGPFAYLRPGSELGASGKIGTFVETKNSRIGTGSKIPHLTYVGDATVGEYSNIGASSVVVNYDGVAKHRTVIGNHCRMGSDTMYVAPVTIGDGASSGAGTVIRQDVPPGALAITVARQRNIEGWAQSRRPDTPQATAAAAAQSKNAASDDAPNEETPPA
ncbi:MAG TPA: bifunctional UDP-N-acetylglucosamine diphosphorylase/glucosamine-1-phosphate N-acetyltransferase GlmU [Ornithinimicrobium sp.]|uniref:bifunctional UDP-N-acetylglucosamine diphosphorylase/glucosamine-1-phosphate N-acetyltransferase GlmU n=1 Tax=Ornithinimicrobium sp. TaxID=1977084 RepID=UPI002B460AEB|nr:bifunctional UDP-N-acetylglucosamine diphosphorylase/glucosamine-1-phosphate N-acetyltransferase GlmU [Ornithinimicrobium sp.]HKJ12870.1 bifunctional UDP-N-acetylglucosamine diphosphorylase/glucosamine-1-phosphate N-acetyltransferase GlmU [Ornithinimicrobium sp.]